MTTKLASSKTEHALTQYKIDNQRLLELQMSGELYRELSVVRDVMAKELQSLLNSEA